MLLTKNLSTIFYRAYHNHDALGSLRQLTDSDGTVTLTKSYRPYGDELSSSGVGASSIGFTGEMQDVATGLVYLRARYYVPGDGRFLTQDPWTGDINRPMSYNGWLYVNANPANLVDLGGQKPVCPPGEEEKCEDQNPPDSVNFNEKIPPPGINFTPNNYYPKPVPIYRAESIDKWDVSNPIPPGTNNSQLLIIGSTSDYSGFCGSISMASIMRLTHPTINANEVIQQVEHETKDADYSYLSSITRTINARYGEYWYAETSTIPKFVPGDWDSDEGKLALARKITEWFPNQFVIAGVLIQGSSHQLNSGKILLENGNEHWLVISGISTPWDPTSFNSDRNWVRVFNPFDNETEYYPWYYFRESWEDDGNIMALVSKKSDHPLLPPPRCRLSLDR